jgi:hypothetical protein
VNCRRRVIRLKPSLVSSPVVNAESSIGRHGTVRVRHPRVFGPDVVQLTGSLGTKRSRAIRFRDTSKSFTKCLFKGKHLIV